jgi:hypothetical protein
VYGCGDWEDLVRGDETSGGTGIPVEPNRYSTRTSAVPACPERTTTITTTTNDGQTKQAPSLFSHPATQQTNGNAAQSANQPMYENLFQEPSIPVHRDTVD